MNGNDVVKAWGRILQGRCSSLSVEITRRCPLRCPGCYAFEPEHLLSSGSSQPFTEPRGQELVDGILDLVARYRPLHVSLVGGEPLLRHRELGAILPRLSEMSIPVQIVTSAVRRVPADWARFDNLTLAVSIDGLPPEHDARRSPATYERILENIEGHSITVHCTVTGGMADRDGYFERYLSFWSERPETHRIWMSLFTPQRGSRATEVLSPDQRIRVLSELEILRTRYPKLDLPDQVIEAYRSPPSSPEDCIFARTTLSLTADLKSEITPCQFGGDPDCSQCGCMASASLKALGEHRLFHLLSLHSIFFLSSRFGRLVSRCSAALNER